MPGALLCDQVDEGPQTAPAVVGLRLVPLRQAEAKSYIARIHRHNRPPLGMIFCVGVADESGDVRGVATVGRPVARNLDDGVTLEVTRVCTDGAKNACSMLYAACARAGRALGYKRILTYTLDSESGASLRAAGWQVQEEVCGEASWDRQSRKRVQVDLYGEEMRPTGNKRRWAKALS